MKKNWPITIIVDLYLCGYQTDSKHSIACGNEGWGTGNENMQF